MRLSSRALVCELSSSVTCSSLILISKLLFCALQMFDSQRCCAAPSGPPVGRLWPQTVQRSQPLHDDCPPAVRMCVWTWCSSAGSQRSLSRFPDSFFICSASRSVVWNPLLLRTILHSLPWWLFKSVYSPQPRLGCCVKSVECTGDSHTQPVWFTAKSESQSQHNEFIK